MRPLRSFAVLPLRLYRSTVVERLIEEQQSLPNVSPVAYFYCARNSAEPERAIPEVIVRTILKQIALSGEPPRLRPLVANEFIKRMKAVGNDEDQCTAFTASESAEMIIELLNEAPATIVIDALDECDPKKRWELFEILDEIVARAEKAVRVFLSSRDDLDIKLQLSGAANVYVAATNNREDIARFIQQELNTSIKRGKLLNGRVSDHHRTLIQDKLLKGAHGM